jgi:hypothetical protein
LSTGTDRAFLLTGLMAGAFQRTLMPMISEGAGAREWVGVVGLEMENSEMSTRCLHPSDFQRPIHPGLLMSG